MGKHICLNDYRSAEKSVSLPADAHLSKVYVADQIKAEGDGRYTFTISTGAVDRDRDTLKVDGWKLENFVKSGGPVLWAHRSFDPPIGKAEWVRVQAGALKARVEFAPPEVYPLAETVRGLIDFGALKSTSVGFLPIRSIWNEERRGFDFEEQELLEFSIVPVPSNPEAILEAKAAGVDMAPFRKSLESALYSLEPGLWMSKVDLEQALRTMNDDEPADGFDPGPVVEAVRDRLTKRGRVLSAANEERIRSARTAAEAIGMTLDEVLSAVIEEDDGDSGAGKHIVRLSPSVPRIPVSAEEVRAAVLGAVHARVAAEVRRHTGRVE